MGLYRIVIEAVGGHGRNRDVKNGEYSQGCGRMGCPDCETRRFARQLQTQANDVKKAVMVHWPEQPSAVEDDLLTGKRNGSF